MMVAPSGRELALELEEPLKADRVYDIRLLAEIKSELSHLSCIGL